MNSKNRATQDPSCLHKKTEALSRPEFPEAESQCEEQSLLVTVTLQFSRSNHARLKRARQGFAAVGAAGAAAAGALLASFGVER